MAKVKSNNFEKIGLNENIYVYKKSHDKFFAKTTIETLFRLAKLEKDDLNCTRLDTLINEEGNTQNGKAYKLSGLILKYDTPATFTSEPINGWEETKLAYLFFIDFGNFLIVTKKNISGLNDFYDTLKPLPYEVIITILYNRQSLLEKFTMDNLESSGSAMTARMVESNNLEESFNYVGANTYTLNHLRINNDDARYTVSANTSRLSKSGEKASLSALTEWTSHIVTLVENFTDRETPLTVFAAPHDYPQERDNLTAVSLTILFSRLLDEIDRGIITDVKYKYKNYPPRKININKHLKGVSQLINLIPGNDPYTYIADPADISLFNDITLQMYTKTIRFSSPRLSQIHLYKNGETSSSVIAYFTNKNTFIVNFDQSEFRYSNRKLFKNSMLLGSIDQFLSVFEPDASINNITAEKGTVTKNSTAFELHTAFHYVENHFAAADYLIVDDLGGEWADHICIQNNELIFIHSKANASTFSATAFTDIVGQAQKNIGSLNAVDSQIRNKSTFWKSYYKKDKVSTKIKRLRKGNGVDSFINRYIAIKSDVNNRKSVYLVVNFISKALLTTNLNKLKNDEAFPQRKETIQILWQISSLISSCREHNIGLHIKCKP